MLLDVCVIVAIWAVDFSFAAVAVAGVTILPSDDDVCRVVCYEDETLGNISVSQTTSGEICRATTVAGDQAGG